MSRKFCFLFSCLLPILTLAQDADSSIHAVEKFLLNIDILPSKIASLYWKNNLESGAGYFFVERRNASGNFETIVTILSKDSSTSYRALDEKPFQGTNQYRIKFVDHEGKTSYSHLVTADIVSGSFCRFYPNPAEDHVIVQTTAKTTVQIFSANGVQILTQNLEKGLVPIDLSSLARGIYVLTFTNTETKFSIRNILYVN